MWEEADFMDDLLIAINSFELRQINQAIYIFNNLYIFIIL